MSTLNLEVNIKNILVALGEDPDREGLIKTPARFIKALKELTVGYEQNPQEILSTLFTVEYDEMVILKNISFTSLCEHHILPFSGKATIAYIPNGKVVGLSKLARLVECFAKRLQIQERMTNQIVEALTEYLPTKGAAVFITAHHYCMGCRGVKQPETQMITSALRGVFHTNPAARAEVLTLHQA